MSESKPRIIPIEPTQWNEEVQRSLGSATSRPPNILMTIAHHPALLGPFLGFAAALATQGLLPRRASEILALRAAWNCRSAFEWGHHVLYARAAGIDDREIEAIAVGPGAASWSATDRMLLKAADELNEAKNICDLTWRELSKQWDHAQLIEIAFVVGNYTMLSMVANASEVPLEPGLPALPEATTGTEE